MTHLQKVLGGISAVALLVGGMIVAQPVLASAWEQVYDITVNGVGGFWGEDPALESGDSVAIKWKTNTTGSFVEYRSAYYGFPPSGSDPVVWNEWTDCRASSTVSGEVLDMCSPTLPTVATTTMIYLRATTNYAGCGTWTPTPDETNCGHSTTTWRWLAP